MSPHLVLLRTGSGRNSARWLEDIAGIHIHGSADADATPGAHPLAAGEGVLFERLDAALVHVDADQSAALYRQVGREVVGMEPERLLKVGQTDSVSTIAPPFAAGLAAGTAATDESVSTWGLTATRVAASRYSGRGVRVAILDTGLDREHPDFSGRSIVCRSFVGDDCADANGHGTYCAGVACGPACPSQPPRYGVAGGADLYIGKIVSDNGSGADGNILAGIDWALRSGCAIVSLSAGTAVTWGQPYSVIFEQVARRALAAGTLIIAAAGNGSLRPDFIAAVDHPANCPSIVSTAAVDPSLRIAPFSCGGVNLDGGAVTIAAPGVAIRSAWCGPALYRTLSGTSMASPFVAGIAALIAEAKPSCRGPELLDLLVRTASPLALPARDVGAGLVQAP